MIAKLSGMIDQLGEGWVVIDVNGVGYLVFCSGKTLTRLFVGEAASLCIETHVREDHIHLYGFYDAHERDWFKLLSTVQGVGTKVALGILSVLSGDELLRAIAAADKVAVSRAPGVGPKLAGRITSELKDKVTKMSLAVPPVEGAGGGAFVGGVNGAIGGGDEPAVRDAVSALVNLGYGASDALGAVSHAASKLGDEELRVEALIRMGLSDLGLKERP